MAATVQLLCLATSSGVPLYCRSKGESRQLPFSVIGSLNGVHMFGSNQDIFLTSTCTDNTRVCWRVFHDSITLIAMSSEEDASDLYLSHLLDNVFSAMVLVIGLDDLVNLKNVERLKRELRACYKLIDSFLAALDWMGDLTQCVDCVVSPHSDILQEALDVFVVAAASESNFGCLMVMGKVVVATEKWWRLTAQEVMLLAWLVGSLAPSTSRDYPIYLPHGSPTVPHRLLTFQLVPGVEVCLLCGPSPSLQQVQTELIERFWSPLLEPLMTCLRVHQRSFSAGIPLHRSVLGLLLVNREQNKHLFTLQPHAVEHSQQQGAAVPPERRRSILRQFYTLAISSYFPAHSSEETSASLHEEFHTGFTHSPAECYIAADDHKCYAIQTQQHQLFLTFTSDTPTFALRNIATKTITLLTKELPF
ncbi:protein fuzzy homolog isoform X1 [Stegostoma tigrinum]|uniref:protein fuzzy homolog isoform X1 n=1 Tax=Stegostoma tigrinum TaxID=3053191 RepID=UPI00287020E0|nr:protein fuzzy homolog isoform X1 [Stegostoma tigrinum]